MVFNEKKYLKSYYLKHKHKIKLRVSLWKRKNRDKVNLSEKRYRDNHKSEIKKRIAKYKQKNIFILRDKGRAYYRANKKTYETWRNNNKDKIKKYHKNYRIKNRTKWLAQTKAERHIKIPKGQKCQNCNIHLATQRHHKDYSKPLDVMFVCRNCNMKFSRKEQNGNENKKNSANKMRSL